MNNDMTELLKALKKDIGEQLVRHEQSSPRLTTIKDVVLPIATLCAIVVGLGFFVSGPKSNREDIDTNTVQITDLRILMATMGAIQAASGTDREGIKEQLRVVEEDLKNLAKNDGG